ncbi:MAG TPA: TerC family protein [Candidatus Hydrogenedentes bacterium]|nr:TerC family protein [Candidatus Hydrogenedentota bacterium]
MHDLLTVESLIALVTLTALEIVLGIDNIVVLAVVTGRLPKAQQPKARQLGLGLAMFLRIGLLLSISFIMSMQQSLFTVLGHPVSGRDIILLGGGLFLIWKAVKEIHEKTEGDESEVSHARAAKSFASAIVQILLLDLVFSLDSVITAVGMAQRVPVMVAAIVLAVMVMMLFAGAVTGFVNRHPTIRMLALAFLLLIGVMLVAEGFGKHIEKGYIYFAMFFSLFVELLNLRAGRHRHGTPQKVSVPE